MGPNVRTVRARGRSDQNKNNLGHPHYVALDQWVSEILYLRTLADEEPILWKSAIALTATSTPANYDTAVRQLIDLRDLSALAGDRNGFSQRLAEFRNLRSRKHSLIGRLDKAELK